MNNAHREEVCKDTVEGEKDTSEEIKLQEKEQQHKTGNNERKESRRRNGEGTSGPDRGTRVQRTEQGCRRRREKREQ